MKGIREYGLMAQRRECSTFTMWSGFDSSPESYKVRFVNCWFLSSSQGFSTSASTLIFLPPQKLQTSPNSNSTWTELGPAWKPTNADVTSWPNIVKYLLDIYVILTLRKAHATWYQPFSLVTGPFLLLAAVMLRKSTTFENGKKFQWTKFNYIKVRWIQLDFNVNRKYFKAKS